MFHCTDPQEYNQFYNANQFSTRDKIKSILLADPRIQKIINGNSCEFMADGTLYTWNGTYRTINVNLNNTKELSASIDLQGCRLFYVDVSLVVNPKIEVWQCVILV